MKGVATKETRWVASVVLRSRKGTGRRGPAGTTPTSSSEVDRLKTLVDRMGTEGDWNRSPNIRGDRACPAAHRSRGKATSVSSETMIQSPDLADGGQSPKPY